MAIPAEMYTVGEISPKAKELIDATYHSMVLGIQQVFPGNRFWEYWFCYITLCPNERVFSCFMSIAVMVLELIFHEDPQVGHISRRNTGPVMQPAWFSPLSQWFNEGKSRTKLDKNDGWTARTIDGKLSLNSNTQSLLLKQGMKY